jgi:hypothetical protein
MRAGARLRQRFGRRAGAHLALGLGAVQLFAATSVAHASAAAAPRFAAAAGPIVSARANEPVILTGSQVPAWTRSAATGVAKTYPSGTPSPPGDGVRSAHNGTLAVPPDARTGVDPNRVAAYAWTGSAWTEIPVQVDQKYQYFLANARSSFSFYSGTDQETTYDWSPTAHTVGQEAWKKVFGQCFARYANSAAEQNAATVGAPGAGAGAWIVNPAAPAAPDDYTGPMPDPVRAPAPVPGNPGATRAELNDDDEIVFMAGDAGVQAPVGTPPPAATDAGSGQSVTIIDPTASTGPGFVYMFTQDGGSAFNNTNGYVQMTWDTTTQPDGAGGPADEWIDRASFTPNDPNKISTSNESYGANLPGTVCRTAAGNDRNINVADGTPRPAYKSGTRRVSRDGMTLTTPTYREYASGRWMVREFSVTAPGTTNNYGPNVISRWKGRAFQQSPDSTISVVGFEDEQVNWEANATLLGWRAGPVRAIREVWGADSGTNVTKTETYYRDADVYHYHVRVHPIPPDGLYTSWDYRLGGMTTYFNQLKPSGVAIDGINDTVGHVDAVPVSGQPAFIDSCDPTFNICSAIDNPEEWAGPYGGIVYVAELVGYTSAFNPAVVPYYRDDGCLDDGTGDGNTRPGPAAGVQTVYPPYRVHPGDNFTDQAVKNAYVDYWRAHGMPSSGTDAAGYAADYAQLLCQPAKAADPATPPWQKFPFQATIGQGGLHFFFTGDTDNNFGPGTTDEIDAQQWRYTVPMSQPTNVIGQYGNNVVLKLQALVVPYGSTPASQVPEAPAAALLVVVGALVLGGSALRRRRRPAA